MKYLISEDIKGVSGQDELCDQMTGETLGGIEGILQVETEAEIVVMNTYTAVRNLRFEYIPGVTLKENLSVSFETNNPIEVFQTLMFII